MSKSKEKLQQFSPPQTTTPSSSSSITELKNLTTQIENNKKPKDDETSKFKRNNNDDHHHNLDDHNSVVKKEQSGGGGNNNNSKPKTIENNRNRKKLKDVNDVITCFLCDGYYIEATTINECLHSFCRSCIVQYLQKSKYCPKCKTFNKSISIANLRPDTTLRSLVYKLVPGLCQSEIQRLVRFNSNNSASSPTSPTIGGNDLTNDLWDFYSPDEMISLSLEYHIYSVIGEQDHTSSISQIRYLKCPAAVTVHHLQRFISSKFNLKPASKFSIEIIYEDEILPEDFSLMDVAYCYKWERLSPMQFFYRIFVKPEKTVPKPVAKCKKVQSVSDPSSPGDDTESHHRVTTPTTIVSTKNNNNNNLNNNDTTKTNNNNNTNISNNDKNNVNNGDNNNNNNNDNKSHVKVESSKAKCKEIKKEVLEEVAVKNEKNNDSSSSNSNKIPNINKPNVSVSPPQPPGDFKILRSNDIRYAITPSSVDRPVDISPKKSNGEKRSKLSIKIERTQSYDDYNNNNSSRKQNEDVVGSSPIKRRASASNSITLKRKYNKSDDEDESGTKKSRSHHHHYHHHQKYEIVQSPKVYDDEPDERELNVPKIKLDLPNLKAKIKVPKLELSSKSGDIKSPTVTSSSSNSSSPRCNSDDVFVENSAKYAKSTIEGSSNFLSTEQASSSHHHKHHHGDNSSSHKKRKKSKHSKDSPTEELSSNGNGNNGYSSNGNSKKRKIHAEISPQTEKSQDDLKLKFKINYKPTEKQRPPIIPTMVIDDDSNDKIVKTPTSPRIVMTLPVPPSASLKSPLPTSKPAPPLITTTTSTSASLILPKPSITPSMPTLISTNKTIPTPTISNSISQDVEEVIKRNKIKKTNIEIPHRMSPNTEEILNEMRAIHSATQAIQKPMVNIPHLSQVHLQSNDPIYGSKSPDVKNTNAMLVSIRNTNPMSMTSSSAMRHQHSSNNRPQMNISVMPGRSQKHGNIKPTPFNLNAATFANNTYTHPRTPFPLPKTINLQRKSCYDIDPIDKKSPQKSGLSTSIFDFPSEPSSDIYTKKEKNQKRLVPPTLFDEPFSSIINSMAKTSKAIELRAKNLFPVTTATTTTTSTDQSPIKSEPPFISSIGNSFISENQNSRTPIQPIQLPPASVSVTNVTNKVASNQIQNQQHLKHSSADHKPVVEILRIQSTTPAVDQQVQPQKGKPNRPPPPLIKRPQTMSATNTGNQSRRTSSSSLPDVKKVENISGSSSKSPKLERKSSSETKEPPVCDNIGALDLSGKSSRSPSLEKSPISKSSSRSNSIEDDSCFNIATSTASATTSSPPKISLSKQKKITDMFPSSSWSVKVENNGSMNISSAERSAAGKSEITITSTTPAPISTVNIGPTSKPPPPKLTEISKLRTYTNSTKSIPTTTATTITSVRQQNLSIRNVPNPSALAFRNQMSPIPISSNNSNSSSSSSNNNNNTVYNGSNANSNKTKVNEGKEIEKVIAHLKANAAADSSSKTVAN